MEQGLTPFAPVLQVAVEKSLIWSSPTTRDWKGKQPVGYKDRGYGAQLPDQVIDPLEKRSRKTTNIKEEE